MLGGSSDGRIAITCNTLRGYTTTPREYSEHGGILGFALVLIASSSAIAPTILSITPPAGARARGAGAADLRGCATSCVPAGGRRVPSGAGDRQGRLATLSLHFAIFTSEKYGHAAFVTIAAPATPFLVNP